MRAAREHPELADALARLRADPNTIPWPARRELVSLVRDALAAPTPPTVAVPLLQLLAEDAKAEVRQAVALALPVLREPDFSRIASKLADDCNAFVQNALQRSLDRRRRNGEPAESAQSAAPPPTEFALMERVHGRRAARHAEEICTRFAQVWAGTTVHNLRGLLTPMKLHAKALQQLTSRSAPADPRAVSDLTGKIMDRMGLVERLLDDMRTFAQPVSTALRRERLADVVHEARTAVADGFREQQRSPEGVELAIDLPEDLTVEMARHQVVVALANVLKNAYEAFADDAGVFQAGQISISATVDAGVVHLQVRDNGPGLAAEDLRELQEFVPGRTTKKNYGTGYGLPIARRYVRGHRGTFAIDSQLGSGTVVSITLPLEREDGEEA